MTKSGFFKLGAIALALVAGLISCDNELPSPSRGALLKTITIAGTLVETLPTPIPLPIPSAVWDEPGNLTGLDDEQTVEVFLDNDADLKQVLVTCTASENARVMWASGTNLSKPEDFYSSSISLSINPVLYVRVISEDRKTTNYYRFETIKLGLVTTISSLTINGEAIDYSNAANSSTESWNDLDLKAANIQLSLDENDNVKVEAVSPNPAAVIQYAKVVKGSISNPVFADTDTFSFYDGDTLYIKVTISDGNDIRWYKFQIKIIFDQD